MGLNLPVIIMTPWGPGEDGKNFKKQTTIEKQLKNVSKQTKIKNRRLKKNKVKIKQKIIKKESGKSKRAQLVLIADKMQISTSQPQMELIFSFVLQISYVFLFCLDAFF
jgi:hypothetical protein